MVLLAASGVALASWPGVASSAAELSGLDLRLDPADVAPAPAPLVLQEPDAPKAQGPSASEIVGEVDQLRQTETPNRRAAGSGPLGSLTADEGLLKELIENKTIPLFRVRIAPPF